MFRTPRLRGVRFFRTSEVNDALRTEYLSDSLKLSSLAPQRAAEVFLHLGCCGAGDLLFSLDSNQKSRSPGPQTTATYVHIHAAPRGMTVSCIDSTQISKCIRLDFFILGVSRGVRAEIPRKCMGITSIAGDPSSADGLRMTVCRQHFGRTTDSTTPGSVSERSSSSHHAPLPSSATEEHCAD